MVNFIKTSDAEYLISEMIDFDNAVGIAHDFAEKFIVIYENNELFE